MSLKSIIYALAISGSALTSLIIGYVRENQAIHERYELKKKALNEELQAIVSKSDSVKTNQSESKSQIPVEDLTLTLTSYPEDTNN